MKFRLLHLLLEICKYSHCFVPVPVGRGGALVAEIVLAPPSGNTPVLLHGDSLFVLGGNLNMVGRLLVGAINRRPVYNTCFGFSCKYFPSSSHCSRSGLPRFWRVGAFHILPAAESEEGVDFASCRTMGRIRCC